MSFLCLAVECEAGVLCFGPQFRVCSSSESESIRGVVLVACAINLLRDLFIRSVVCRWADRDNDIIFNALSVLLALWPTVWAMSAIEDSKPSDETWLTDGILPLEKWPAADDMSLLSALLAVYMVGYCGYWCWER